LSSPINDPDFYNGCNKPEVFHDLLFGLCFFHAMVQERIRFGPLGWNIPYEFNDSDLEAGMLLLKMFLEEQPYVPYDALQYMTAVNGYGGRVTDFLDERCIETVLTKFYNPAVLKVDYCFDSKGVYKIPSGEGNLQAFVDYTKTLPLTDPPDVFGMHENASITVQFNETRSILGVALSVQPRDAGGGGGKTSDEVVSELATEFASRMPPVLMEEEAGPTTFVIRGEYMDSLGTALKQELTRYNNIIVKMASTLIDIQRAIRGEVLMSAELDEQYTAMLNNQVRALWCWVGFTLPIKI
jgi:dynein heavy chain